MVHGSAYQSRGKSWLFFWRKIYNLRNLRNYTVATDFLPSYPYDKNELNFLPSSNNYIPFQYNSRLALL